VFMGKDRSQPYRGGPERYVILIGFVLTHKH